LTTSNGMSFPCLASLLGPEGKSHMTWHRASSSSSSLRGKDALCQLCLAVTGCSSRQFLWLLAQWERLNSTKTRQLLQLRCLEYALNSSPMFKTLQSLNQRGM
ncbi:MAG TPA: hypothetical protein VFN63_09470, partial [Pseudolabrys sp.]|nr:hypothetical protein [Pseudolabrys sp.]